MHIAAVKGTIVRIPLARPVVSSVRHSDQVINVLVEVETDEGAVGVSYVAAFTLDKARAVCALLRELGEVLRGLDARAIGEAWDRMWAACTLVGHAGLSVFALSAVDIALWDLLGKCLGAPVHRLLGTRHTTLSAYASDGCWLGREPDGVAEEASTFAAQGFRAIKVRFGRCDPDADIATLAAVRGAVGPSVRLMVDVNQGWSLERARAYGRRLAEFNVEWFEEPLPAEDVRGLAALRRELSVAITAGENAYMLDGVRALLEAEAVSILMPDVQRVGGISGWVRANALAEAWHVPITSHLFPEVSVHLLASSRNPGPIEWVSWMVPLLQEPLTCEHGDVTVPDRPGLGMTFDPEAVRHYQVE